MSNQEILSNFLIRYKPGSKSNGTWQKLSNIFPDIDLTDSWLDLSQQLAHNGFKFTEVDDELVFFVEKLPTSSDSTTDK